MIGGGAAGLAAAPGLPAPLELGAEFIDGRAAPTFELLARAGVAAGDATDSYRLARDGGLVPMDDAYAGISRPMAPAPKLRRDVAFADHVARRTGTRERTRALATMMVEGFDAADPARVGVRRIATEWDGGAGADAPQFRPAGGYGPLLDALGADLHRPNAQLRRAAPVTAIRWRRGHADVEYAAPTGPARIVARHVLATARRRARSAQRGRT